MTAATGLLKSKFNTRSRRHGHSVAVSPSTGLTASYTTGITTGSTEVAVIDKIVFSTITPDAACNTTIWVRINGIELPFHFPGTANSRASTRYTWRTNGNLVVHPSQTLQAKASRNLSSAGIEVGHSSISVHYRRMRLQAAMQEGLFAGGTMPNVASTQTLTAGALTAGTARKIVTGVTGRYIQILGFVFTGHNFAATGDSARIGFWDGTTGSFAANSNRFFKAYTMGADVRYAPTILVGDTKGCIQGATGLSLYVDATTNLAGADSYRFDYDGEASGPFQVGETLTFGGGGTAVLLALVDAGATGQMIVGPVTGTVPVDNATITGGTSSATANINGTVDLHTPGDFNVIYRFIDRTDTMNNTGAVGGTALSERFWIYTETGPTVTTGASIAWFGAGVPSRDLHILGQAASFQCVNEAVASSTAGIGLGTDSTLPITDLHIANSDAAGTPAEVSSAFCDEDSDTRVSTAFAPAFTGTMLTASGLERTHLVWGLIGGETQTGSAPANIGRFA